MTDRRQFLAGSAKLAMLAGFPGLALSQDAGDARLVMVILRGGLDGLAAAPPYGESRYRDLRGSLALDSPGQTNGVLKLDGLFGLHPALRNMHDLYQAGELAVLHAVATSYRERSHFDGQNVLENGSAVSRRIARRLVESGGRIGQCKFERDRAQPEHTSGTARRRFRDELGALAAAGSRAMTRWLGLPISMRTMPTSRGRLREAVEARRIAGQMSGRDARRIGGNRQQLGPVIAAAGRFLSAPDGPRIAVLEAGGWDTHANQGAGQGTLATRLGGLDSGLARLKQELGDHWQRTIVVVATEFGRTVEVNGTRGTDHGTGGCAFCRRRCGTRRPRSGRLAGTRRARSLRGKRPMADYRSARGI